MTRLELTPEEAEVLEELIRSRLREIDIEINRSDSLDFKEGLRKMERVLGRVLGQFHAD